MNYRKALLATLLAPMVAVGSGAATKAHAAGYAVFTHGASALGQGNAVTAHTDNPSTIFYNPALMNKLDGTQLQIGTTAIISSREYSRSADPAIPGDTGSSTSNTNTFFPSTFYATHKFNDSLSAGLGVFNPFGLGTEWDDNWEGKYIATESKLTTYNVNPVVSYRVIPSLAVAVGVDVIFLEATLDRTVNTVAINPLLPPADFNSRFKGDGTGVGFNVGVAYDITPALSFGASYRSQVVIDVEGESTTSPTFLVPGPAGPVAMLDSDGKTTVTLPPQVTAAFAYQVSKPLVIEAGVRWEGWSTFEDLELKLDNGTPVPSTSRDWHDTFGLNVGGKYRLNDTYAVSLGYVYGNTAVPDATFDPSIPDAKTHVFCVGTDANYNNFNVAFSYAYQLYENRTKHNDIGASPLPTTAANGKYESDAHLLALSLGYKF